MQNKEATRCYKSIARDVEQLKKEVNSTRGNEIFLQVRTSPLKRQFEWEDTRQKKRRSKPKVGVGIVASFGISTKFIITIGHCLGVNMSC